MSEVQVNDTATPVEKIDSALTEFQGADLLAGIRAKQPALAVEEEVRSPEPSDKLEGTPLNQKPQSESKETEAPEEKTHVVELALPDGTKITADDAVKGYLRHSDYTRKTQALADERRTLQAGNQESIQKLQSLLTALEAQAEKEPDWIKVLTDDPINGPVQKAMFEKRQSDRQEAIRVVRANEQKALHEAKAKAFDDLATGEYNKAWADKAVLNADLGKIDSFLQSRGFTPDELQSITQARYIELAYDAYQWRELQKAKPTAVAVVKELPKVVRPGASNGDSKGKERSAVMNRFHQTRTEADGLAALAALRGQSVS